MTPPIAYSADFSDSLIEEAVGVIARRAVRRQLTPLLRAAMVVNVVGFGLLLFFLGDAPLTWGLAVLAFVVPLYWPALLVWAPPRMRRRMAALFHPQSDIELGQAGFSVAAKGRSWSLPWSDVGRIEEHPRFFLFVLRKSDEPVVIPSAAMPAAARSLLNDVAAGVVAYEA